MREKLIRWALNLAEVMLIGVLDVVVVIICAAAGSWWLRRPSESEAWWAEYDRKPKVEVRCTEHDAGAFAGDGITWTCGASGYPEHVAFGDIPPGVVYNIQGPTLGKIGAGDAVSVSVGSGFQAAH